MVNLTQVLLRKNPSKGDPYWRRRQILRLSAHLYGRARNCFTIAIKKVQRSLQNVVRGRQLRKVWFKQLCNDRISAGVQELGYLPHAEVMHESLQHCEVHLNRSMLANLAIWEPRTFKALNKIAAIKAHQDGIQSTMLGPMPQGVITRGML